MYYCVTYLKRLEKTGVDDHLFVNRSGESFSARAGVRKAFETACRKAKLYDVKPHTTRQPFASRLAMAGLDLRTIQELGGWEEITMLERYAHLSPQHKAEAVERLVRKQTGEKSRSIPRVIPQLVENDPRKLLMRL